MDTYYAVAGTATQRVTVGFDEFPIDPVADYGAEPDSLAALAYAEGEVYTVALENLLTYRDVADPAREITRWEVQDSISGIVFSDTYDFRDKSYDVAVVARECLDAQVTDVMPD